MGRKERKKLRRYEILTKLFEEGRVNNKERAEHFDVSHPTILNDIKKLSRMFPQVKKVRGGAELQESQSPWPKSGFQDRLDIHKEEKMKVAYCIAEHIFKRNLLGVGGGTTMQYVINQLKEITAERIYIVSYSLPIIYSLSEQGHIDVVDTGGLLESGSLGVRREEFKLRQFLEDSGVLTKGENRVSCDAAAVSFRKYYPLKNAFTSYKGVESGVKSTLLKSAKEIFVGIDHSKIESGEIVGRKWDIEEFFSSDVSLWLITDNNVTSEQKELLNEAKNKSDGSRHFVIAGKDSWNEI